MKVLDILINTPLFEMAYERRKAIEIVNSRSRNIVLHLLKIFAISGNKDRNHWMSEIDSWLGDINDIFLKPKRKRPSKQDLYNWLLIENVPDYDAGFAKRNIAIWKNNSYNSYQFNDIDAEFVMNKIVSILEKVVEDISNDNFFGIQDYLEGAK